MKLPLYQVDAFTSRPFAGNPAAVVPLENWLADSTLQAIAAENNLSETAFFVKNGDRYHLRWMTPAVEVDLCGHATLASAYVIFQHLEPHRQSVAFDTRSGELLVERDGELLSLDLPARKPTPCPPSAALADALGAPPAALFGSRDYLALYQTEEEVLALAPDMAKLSAIDRFAVIATAPGRNCDFVSRFFAPAKGVPEDPVTGSAHASLVPFWGERLGKQRMFARQVSSRGGELHCEWRGERVIVKGQVAPYLEGAITLPDAD
ncbi:MAG: PhzF family phenazine biosynthesis protein [Bryobacteraceae bacterium]|nr:PhzF family phenazine biosynthesis protein [Bryobacteraceae bacterium]